MNFWGKISKVLLSFGESPAERKIKESTIENWYLHLSEEDRKFFPDKSAFEKGFRDVPVRKVDLAFQIYQKEANGQMEKEPLSSSDKTLVENAYLAGYHQAKEEWKWSKDEACKRGDQVAWFALHIYRYC
ncbi:MAG: hypothetical protein PHU64_02650 [Candidatus Omnitrophica bacterium]|nr:hypothetical protein [Candidatus Omnitrophota bacterium]MDD5430495.1 hypothetical protein [Candidatus Omnitrophota bacterium]